MPRHQAMFSSENAAAAPGSHCGPRCARSSRSSTRSSRTTERSATKLVGIAVTCSSASSNAACTLLRQSDDEPSRLVAAQWHGFGCLLVSAAHQLQTIAQVNSCKRLLIRLWAAQRERWGHLLALHSSSSDLSSYHGSRQQTLTSRTCQWLVPFRMCPVHQAITPLLHPLLIHDGMCVLDT